MKKLTHLQIRQMWIDFFKSKNHLFLEPVSLIPYNDESLLWVNSGVATLKRYFDGSAQPPSPRLVNSQKSIRTNDVENVGKTARHHTFFEMLGNFSIGDYFKKEAIEFAYEFLTSAKYLGLEKDKLYITVFEEDQDAYDSWINVGVAKDHIIKGTRKTNFWEIGQGPCGPNTEMFYDRGIKYDAKNVGIKLLKDDIENDRYIELWNIVFSQFNNDGEGHYTDLPRKNIDTGAGLERIASVLQEAPTNFDTDLFQPIIKAIEKHTALKYNIDNYFKKDPVQTEINYAFKVIADHVRTLTFAIADGATPGNSGRGYVLRKLLRRSIIFSTSILKTTKPYLSTIVQSIIETMQGFYTHLIDARTKILETIEREEVQYFKTLEDSKKIAQKEIDKLGKKFSEKDAFKLYETHGLPVELTTVLLKNIGVVLDEDKLVALVDEHQNKARLAHKQVAAMAQQSPILNSIKDETIFDGYVKEIGTGKVIRLISEDKEVKQLQEGQIGIIVLDHTTFYATAGGQVFDTGTMDNENTTLIVNDVFKGPNGNRFHLVDVDRGTVKIGDVLTTNIDLERRKRIASNHSGTHISIEALQTIIGKLPQASAYYDEFKMRNGFLYDKTITPEIIEQWVAKTNKWINEDLKRVYKELPFDEAKEKGYSFVEEKEFTKTVRTVTFGNNLVTDICGGTHVASSKALEIFILTNLMKKSAGVYEFEAVTKFDTAIEFVKESYLKWQVDIETMMASIEKMVSSTTDKELVAEAKQVLKDTKALITLKDQIINGKVKKEKLFEDISLVLDKLPKQLPNLSKVNFKLDKDIKESFVKNFIAKYSEISKHVKPFKNINLVFIELDEVDSKLLREISLTLINTHEIGLVIVDKFASKNVLSIIMAGHKNVLTNFNAKTMFEELSSKMELKGGGAPNILQASTDLKNLDKIKKYFAK